MSIKLTMLVVTLIYSMAFFQVSAQCSSSDCNACDTEQDCVDANTPGTTPTCRWAGRYDECINRACDFECTACAVQECEASRAGCVWDPQEDCKSDVQDISTTPSDVMETSDVTDTPMTSDTVETTETTTSPEETTSAVTGTMETMETFETSDTDSSAWPSKKYRRDKKWGKKWKNQWWGKKWKNKYNKRSSSDGVSDSSWDSGSGSEDSGDSSRDSEVSGSRDWYRNSDSSDDDSSWGYKRYHAKAQDDAEAASKYHAEDITKKTVSNDVLKWTVVAGLIGVGLIICGVLSAYYYRRQKVQRESGHVMVNDTDDDAEEEEIESEDGVNTEMTQMVQNEN